VLRSIHESHSRDPNLARLRFPKIFTELSNENIMVSQYVPGHTLDELLEKGELKYETLLEFFRIQGFYIFKVGTFHGDIHPGNVIVHEGLLYFIDTGAVNHAPPELSRNLFLFFHALVECDYDACASHLMAMSEVPPNDQQKSAVRLGVQKLYAGFSGRTVSEISLSRQMMETIKTAVLEGLRFPDAMFPVIKSFMFLDGMVLRCRPEADLIADMKPFIKAFAKELSLD
jgi:ubiquinone biosynthesis protein